MPWRPKNACIQCGVSATEKHISARGLCSDCGADNIQANAEQLHAKSGPAYNYWRKRQLSGSLAYIEKMQAQITNATRQ